jgi:mutator protein MutT
LPDKKHHETAAGIVVRRDQVLLCRRRDDRDWYPGAWDVVGGHRETGETMEATLRRECSEELGIAVESAEHLLTVEDSWLAMSIFLVTDWTGEPRNEAPDEHVEVRWFSRDDLDDLAFPDPRLHRILAMVLDHGPDRNVTVRSVGEVNGRQHRQQEEQRRKPDRRDATGAHVSGDRHYEERGQAESSSQAEPWVAPQA